MVAPFVSAFSEDLFEHPPCHPDLPIVTPTCAWMWVSRHAAVDNAAMARTLIASGTIW
jgi:hypothetical protein